MFSHYEKFHDTNFGVQQNMAFQVLLLAISATLIGHVLQGVVECYGATDLNDELAGLRFTDVALLGA